MAYLDNAGLAHFWEKIKTYVAQQLTAAGGLTMAEVLAVAHPVDSYYWSDDPTSPAQLFGGTWEQIKDAFLLAAGDSHAAGDAGGAETVTLTESEMPPHTHDEKELTGAAHFRRYGTAAPGTNIAAIGTEGIVSHEPLEWSGSHSLINTGGKGVTNPYVDSVIIDATHEHASVGGGAAHNNMPPYLAAYCWHRIA